MHKSITNFKLHIIELKYNFIISFISLLFLFIICTYFTEQIIYIFIKTLLEQTTIKYLIYTEITEFFFLNFYLSLILSIIINIPFLIIQIWFFLKKGFTKKENYIIIKLVLIFLIINFFSFYIIIIKIIPKFWIYFYNINFINNYIFNIYLEPKLYDYFLFIFTFFIYIYLIFIYPFILYIIYTIYNIKIFINYKNIFYLIIINIIFILTPFEISTQLLYLFLIIFILELYIYLYIYYNKYINI